MLKQGDAEVPFPPVAAVAGTPHATHRTGTLGGISGAEWGVLLLSFGAWGFLAIGTRPDGGQGAAPTVGSQAAGLAAMIAAMMLPLTIGRVRALVRSGPPVHPYRSTAAFLAGYMAVWLVAMLAIDTAWRLTVSVAGWAMAAGVVIAAAVLWEVAPAQRRQWRRGNAGGPPHGREGLRMEIGCGRLGFATGTGCVASCWALMAACVAFAHSLPVMAAFFVIQLHGMYRRPASPALTALAVLGVCLVSLAMRTGGHYHHPGM